MEHRLLLSVIFLLLGRLVTSYVKEAADGSVCFNNCNGHGDCIDYSCHCWLGYHGDDCGSSFVEEGQRVVPILSAGHFNLTRKNFTTAVVKSKMMLVGFSAYSCHRCIAVESEYEKIALEMTKLGLTFARADADQLKSIALEHDASELPALVLFQKSRPLPYSGAHKSEAVMTYIEKQMSKSTRTLQSIEEVESFLASRISPKYSTSTVMVIGFFADHEGIEEDDYEDFIEVAKDMQQREDVYFAVVTKPKVCEWYKKNKTIDRTPSVMLLGDNGVKTINLDEIFGEKFGLKEWIDKNAIPLLGKLTHANFKLYEKIPNPMLMLFLDLTNEHSSLQPGQVVGGKSGKILNVHLLDEFRHVAKEHSERITFVYLDGNLHEDRMKTLGLFGGRERLPSIAFNTREALQIPFPEELPINRDTLFQFCADFVSGKLKSAHDTSEMAKKVLQAVRPVNQMNKAQRKEKKKAPKRVQGVSEQYGDGSEGDLATKAVTIENFDEVVMDDTKDVILLLHAQGSEACSHFSVYYKHMAKRFKALSIDSLVIARMDLTDASPPPDLNLVSGSLPLVIMFPAGQKMAPWTYYSGVGKVGPMMKWAQEHSTTHFELPNMPHLDEEQRVLFKQQVREREEDLELKRKEDSRAMAAEDRAQKEMKRKKKNELKRKRLADELLLNNEGTVKTSNNEGNVELTPDVTIKLDQTHLINAFKESTLTDLKKEASEEVNEILPQKKDEKEDEKDEKKEEQKIEKVESSLNEEL